MKTISVVSPCYNEEDNVETCYETVKAIFARDLPGYRLEHVFIDNASTDRTVEILRGIAARDPGVRVVVNARNFGVFRSTFNGLRHASGDAILGDAAGRSAGPARTDPGICRPVGAGL